MRSKTEMKETDIAACVVEHLTSNGWEVFQEVCVGGPRADIVAVFENLVWIIEVKQSMTLALLDQVVSWIGKANYISTATPKPVWKSKFAEKASQDYGIGHIWVRGRSFCTEHLAPRLNRCAATKSITRNLHEDQKTKCLAGTNRGGYSTAFSRTVDCLKQYVSKNEGCLLKTAIADIKHHYSSSPTAVACIRNLISKGVIDGLIYKDGHLYLPQKDKK